MAKLTITKVSILLKSINSPKFQSRSQQGLQWNLIASKVNIKIQSLKNSQDDFESREIYKAYYTSIVIKTTDMRATQIDQWTKSSLWNKPTYVQQLDVYHWRYYKWRIRRTIKSMLLEKPVIHLEKKKKPVSVSYRHQDAESWNTEQIYDIRIEKDFLNIQKVKTIKTWINWTTMNFTILYSNPPTPKESKNTRPSLEQDTLQLSTNTSINPYRWQTLQIKKIKNPAAKRTIDKDIITK